MSDSSATPVKYGRKAEGGSGDSRRAREHPKAERVPLPKQGGIDEDDKWLSDMVLSMTDRLENLIGQKSDDEDLESIRKMTRKLKAVVEKKAGDGSRSEVDAKKEKAADAIKQGDGRKREDSDVSDGVKLAVKVDELTAEERAMIRRYRAKKKAEDAALLE